MSVSNKATNQHRQAPVYLPPDHQLHVFGPFKSPNALSRPTIEDYEFTGDGATTVFTAGSSTASSALATTVKTIVTISGAVKIPTTDYAISISAGAIRVTFAVAPGNTTKIGVRAFLAPAIEQAFDGQVSVGDGSNTLLPIFPDRKMEINNLTAIMTTVPGDGPTMSILLARAGETLAAAVTAARYLVTDYDLALLVAETPTDIPLNYNYGVLNENERLFAKFTTGALLAWEGLLLRMRTHTNIR